MPFWNINPAAVRAGKLPMAFVFTNNNNERILFDLPIKQASAAGGDEGMAMDHSKMGHGAMGAEEPAADAAKK